MKTLKKLSMIAFIIFIILFSQQSNGSPLNENDFFLYEIVKSEYYLEIGENKKIEEGFQFGNSSYPSGTIVNATIQYIYSYGIQFKNWINNTWEVVFLAPNWFDFKVKYDSYYTLFNTYKLIEGFGNVYYIDFTILFNSFER